MSTLVVSVAASADDAAENANETAFSDNAITLRADSSGGESTRWNAGMRFTNITIPSGSTIASATLTIDMPDAVDDNPDLDIFANDVDDALDFAAEIDVTSRVRTAASTPWVETNLGAGLSTSPNFASAIQEVINRGGWVGGNALVVLMRGRTVNEQDFRPASQDHPTDDPPQLVIEYTPPRHLVLVAFGPQIIKVPDEAVAY